MSASLPQQIDPTGRFFVNEALNDPAAIKTVPSPREHLITSLTDLIKTCPPSLPWSGCFAKGLYCGIFTGPTSVAFLFLWLSRTHPDLRINDKSAAEYCGEYLNLGQDQYGPEETVRSGCSLNHEYMCYNAVKACYTKELEYVDKFVENVDKLTLRPTFMEVLFGKAGLLNLMRMMKNWVPDSKHKLDPVIDKTIEYCLSYNPWTFGIQPDNQKRFIGAGHGDISIISNIVMSNPAYAGRVQERLEELLDLQTEEGNWTSCYDGGADLVQFCHGAPGVIWCLEPMKQYFPVALQQRIDRAIRKGRSLIWKKGLLTKEPCLCHGSTGNAMVLEQAEKEHFLYYSTPEMVKTGRESEGVEKSSDNSGLWWSEAGRSWAWMMADYDLEGRGDSLVDIGYPGVTNP